MLKKATLIGSAILLSACGGGGDDGGSASGGGLPSSDRYVAGTFMDASVNPDASAFLRSAGPSTVGLGGDACSGETNYFETEDGRVRVYGSAAFSETDFRVVSTMIHERLDSMIAKFGMTWAEFVDQRAHIIRDHLSVLVQNFDPALQASGGPTDPTDVSNEPSQPLTDADRWAAWNALSLDEQIAFAELMVEPDRDFRLPRTVLIACLNPDMGGSMFGEGTQIGINVPPNTSTYHSRVGEIFAHEIVHFVQENIADVGMDNVFGLMPRWFSEGQAVYLAGQEIASVDHHHHIDAPSFATWGHEQDSSEDRGLLYEHYGLAYKYVHENNGMDTITDMMQSMKTNTDTPHLWVPYDPGVVYSMEDDGLDPGLAFGAAFAQYINDHTGADLEVRRYINEYHDLMNSWGGQ